MKKYLRKKINKWYENTKIDYDVTGSFIDAKINGNDLRIIWEEMGEEFEIVISWFAEYTFEQLYNIWMEEA